MEEESACLVGTVVVVDDEEPVLRMMDRALSNAGFDVLTFAAAQDALDEIDASVAEIDVVLSDIAMPGMSGIQLLEELRDRYPVLPVVLMTGRAELDLTLNALRLGAYDFLLKPIETSGILVPAIRRAVEHRRLLDHNLVLQRSVDADRRAPDLVGSSAVMCRLRQEVASVARSDLTVLIEGESGTGKELVARAIHQQSPRQRKAFIDVNCASLIDSVLQSELFGHVKGAFTGASSSRIGLFEEASGGTLFLDEVGELAAGTQAQLLRALQDGSVRPVGANRSRQCDTRVVAATNRDIQAQVDRDAFRQDLYYRLAVVTIKVPPLRERLEDVPELVAYFLEKRGARRGASPEELDKLLDYDWPGNVRELENVVNRSLVFSGTGTLRFEHSGFKNAKRPTTPVVEAPLSLADARAAFECQYVREVLKLAGGNMSEAARIADVDRSNFRRLVRRFDIDLSDLD